MWIEFDMLHFRWQFEIKTSDEQKQFILKAEHLFLCVLHDFSFTSKITLKA